MEWKRYTAEYREWAIQQMMPPVNRAVTGAEARPLQWTPSGSVSARVQSRDSVLDRPDYYWLSLIGRLAPGHSRQAAEAEMTAALRRFLTAKYGGSDLWTRFRDVRIEMVDGSRGISLARQQDASFLMLLAAVASMLLIVTCANVATLLLCRATLRQSEVALRRALGALREA